MLATVIIVFPQDYNIIIIIRLQYYLQLLTMHVSVHQNGDQHAIASCLLLKIQTRIQILSAAL